MDPREKSLPKWAQEIINDLRRRINVACEPLIRELNKLRPLAEVHAARYGAMIELLQCAAKGGHATANEIVNIIEEFDLVLKKKEE